MTITRLSTRGQLVIPKEVRDRHGWGPGTELEVVDLGDRVLLRPVAAATVGWDDLVGCTGYDGPPRSDAEIRTAVDELLRRRWQEAGAEE